MTLWLSLSPTQWPQKPCVEIVESQDRSILAPWITTWKGVSLENHGSCSGLYVSKIHFYVKVTEIWEFVNAA